MILSKETIKSYSIKKIKKERSNKIKKLSDKIVIGTIQKRTHVCYNPNCKCMNKDNPQPHGPYTKLAYRGKSKPGTLVLNEKQKKYAEKMIKNYLKVKDLLSDISSLNIELLRRKSFSFL